MHLTFTLICLVGPMVPALRIVEERLKSKYGDFPYSCDLESALQHYYTDIDHGHLGMEALKKSCRDVAGAVSRVIGGLEPILRGEDESKRNIFITGFPYTVDQAQFLRQEWPQSRLVIHFLDSHDGEAWESYKATPRDFLKEIADDFVLEYDASVCLLAQ